MKYIIYCDGATSQSNPSDRTGVGIICYKENPKIEIFRVSQFTGRGSNNFAEYMSVIIGLKTAASQGIQDIDVYMDSQLVVRQCKLEWQVKEPSLKPLHAEVEQLKKQFKNISFYWIPRTENGIADKLSKEALNG